MIADIFKHFLLSVQLIKNKVLSSSGKRLHNRHKQQNRSNVIGILLYLCFKSNYLTVRKLSYHL